MEKENKRKALLEKIKEKNNLEQQVFHEVLGAFTEIKEILENLVAKYTKILDETGIEIEYKKVGKYDLQLRVGSDMLVFSMHPNVFVFNKDNVVWQHSYMKNNAENAYVGQISIYNFLADSFVLNHPDDIGYLVARIFVNREKHYLLEGKRQLSYRNHDISECVVNKERLTDIIETAIGYVVDFDLLVPPYEAVKVVTVAQMKHKARDNKLQTGKRLGFQFNTDDI